MNIQLTRLADNRSQNDIRASQLLPIQLRCMVLTCSGPAVQLASVWSSTTTRHTG